MEELLAFASNNQLLSMVWVALVIMIVIVSIKIKLSPIKQLNPQELTLLVNRNEGVVVDIRIEKEFKKSHILDAISLSPEKLKNNDLASIEKHKAKPIIIVCATGMTSSKAATDLYKLGYTQVSLLKGGMNTWVNASLPVTK